MKYRRQKYVDQMLAWEGLKESDGSYKAILNTYNSYRPLPRGHKMTASDEWCAATVSAAAIAVGYTEIIPIECSCNNLIKLAQERGIWVEDDAYVPQIGDICLYDWDDTGKGDDTGRADHVGAVVAISGKKFVVMEGNKNNAVARRTMDVNGKFIRGFICPKYDEPLTEAEEAIEWIQEAGIMKGDLSGDLMLDRAVTRRQFAVMLYRFNKTLGR